MHGDLNLHRRTRTGDCKTCAQLCLQMEADFISVLLVDGSESGDGQESDLRTVILWN